MCNCVLKYHIGKVKRLTLCAFRGKGWEQGVKLKDKFQGDYNHLTEAFDQ